MSKENQQWNSPQTKFVNGAVHIDWRELYPGDCVITTKNFSVSWPPDGTRTLISGSFLFHPPLIISTVFKDEMFIVISHSHRYNDGVSLATESILLFKSNIWYVGTTSFPTIFV